MDYRSGAILYARVSTDERARSGYSLAQQLEVLREYAAREGYEVLEEVVLRITVIVQPDIILEVSGGSSGRDYRLVTKD